MFFAVLLLKGPHRPYPMSNLPNSLSSTPYSLLMSYVWFFFDEDVKKAERGVMSWY